MNHLVTKQLVKMILKSAGSYSWSLQGLGMLRLYLSEEIRLHVWNFDFAFPNASTMHTHPWDFESLVVAGELEQTRYIENENIEGDVFNTATILCGEGGCIMSEPEKIKLSSCPMEHYVEGQTYTERAEEIHESFPLKGTVTLVTRRFRQDRDHAKVFRKPDSGWVSAEPRSATDGEVEEITRLALERWFE